MDKILLGKKLIPKYRNTKSTETTMHKGYIFKVIMVGF